MSGYTMHQDGAWWAGFPITEILTAMVAIDSAGADNGGLELFAVITTSCCPLPASCAT